MRRRNTQQAFTLIELLIVVAIIAILALIAVPNFLEAQVRAKVSRVKSDMRSLATALEAYRVDHNTLPPWDSWKGHDLARQWPGRFWKMLTTPVAYITSPLRDPFVLWTVSALPGSLDNLDWYFQVGVGSVGTVDTDGLPSDLWCSASFGPDWTDDTGSMGQYPYVTSACPYDPTNGSVSRGDVYRHSGRPPTNFLSDLDMPVSPTGLSPWW